MSKHVSIPKLYVFLIIGVLTTLVCLLVVFKHTDIANYTHTTFTRSKVSDSDTEADLYTIEKAVLSYPANNSGNALPATLNQVNISGLHGKVADYRYSPIQQSTGGGPTISYKICAVFATKSSKLDSASYQSYFQYSSPEGYTYHEAGTQCFSNEYYKDESHIKLVGTR
jgi:hypothetical protein